MIYRFIKWLEYLLVEKIFIRFIPVKFDFRIFDLLILFYKILGILGMFVVYELNSFFPG